MLHSRVAKVLTFPPLTFLLYVISPWALYFSGWYAASLDSSYVHEAMHVHLVVVGCCSSGRWWASTRCPAGSPTRSGCCWSS